MARRVIKAPGTVFRIDAVWAAVSVDAEGWEGLCARWDEKHGWMPLLAADEDRLPFIIDCAEELARNTQQMIRIIRLSSREEIKVFDGRQ